MAKMAEYIDKHKLIDGILYELDASESIGDKEEYAHWGRVLPYVRKAPAADVRPVVRGKWELKTFDDGYGEYQIYECDKCGAVTAQRRNYCPNCGADMRETDGEEAKRIKKQLALNGLGYPYDLPKREES